MKSKNLNELWDMTEGTPSCPKCDSVNIGGLIREINGDLATVDWDCENCGHKWSNRCSFEDGCLTPIEEDGSWIGLV